MNDVERLAEALRRANAELKVDSDELTEAVEHAHRRLLGRLLAVAVLSAIGALLLLSGGLAASSAVKDARNGSSVKEQASKDPGKPKQPAGTKKGSGGHSGENENHGHGSGKPKKQEKQRKSKSNIGSGEKTKSNEKKPIIVSQPNLRVVSLTKTSIEVINDGTASSEPFLVTVKVEPVEGEQLERSISFEELAAKKSKTVEFTEELTCESGQIVAEIDPENSVKEAEEEDNIDSEKCEPIGATEEKGKEKTQGEGESTTSSVTTPSVQ